MLKVSIVLHYDEKNNFSSEHVQAQIDGIAGQTYKNIQVIVTSPKPESAKKIFADLEPVVIDCKGGYAETMNKAIEVAEGEWICYCDNRENPLFLKKAALDGFMMGVERQADAGLFYTSYELEDGGEVKEIYLLDHHIGRVRDNMDYGKVFFLKKEALQKIGGFDTNVKYKNLYDLRLKISEHYKLYRIANRYSGSYYRVVAAGKKADVFDYLKAGKDIQLEAERVVTEHLKRIGAYLKPGYFAPKTGKYKDESTLKASVIIPVGQRPEFIGAAIESVQRQTVQDIEVIVMVNGGDDDPTADVVRKYMEGGEKYDAAKP